MKLIMVDLDGTLFDTKRVNYLAYKEAIKPFGYSIDYDYYCEYCNGRYYMDFLPQITTDNEQILLKMHAAKKQEYKKHLASARLNVPLSELLYSLKDKYKIALVTTASKENTFDILEQFDMTVLFDLILTHEDVSKSKPDPEGYIKAMEYFEVRPDECVVFEDSDTGVEAAVRSGVQCFVVKGYN